MPPIPIILFDLDETLHKSVTLKAAAWKHILSGLGFCWEEDKENDGSELPGVATDLRPQRGLAPQEFIRQLIVNLGITTESIDEVRLKKAGFQPQPVKRLLEIKQEGTKRTTVTDDFITVVKDEWASRLLQAVKDLGVEAVEGAPEMVKRFHDAGFRIGIVTQAPNEYAQAVLRSLGLITKETSYIEAIVSGEMVAKPKPDPEPLMLATQIILFTELYGKLIDEYGSENAIPIEEKIGLGKICQGEFLEKNKPIAYIGDSVSDVKAGRAWNLRVIVIRNETTNLAQIVELGAEIIVTPENIHPRLFGNETNIDHSFLGSIER